MEEFLRIALIVLFCLLTGLRLYYKMRFRVLHLGFTPFSEGTLLGMCRLSLGLPLLAGLAAAMHDPLRFAWMRLPLPYALRAAGVALGVLSLILLWWVQNSLGANFSTTITLRRNHTLVISGPYHLVRHPMYVAYLGFFLAGGLISANWIVGLFGVAIFAMLMTVRLRKEERLLIERFGAAYREYSRNTPRFLPRPRSDLRS
jgi:protein-S-isoprenylcysteine O-methyltransferase Ste14